jgi:hypothetical protein
MSIWFICALIALQVGGALFAAFDKKLDLSILMVAGIMANVSALLMAMRAA